ncbi:GlsB/YeaQ/YmgE family stress response membrane protein [Thermoleophilia bacterium SCSIO 60948]|nr:GlsB/YeaQ/YmgE family stress response membrane protein [Thermoleophilia bacterium SCSIO 60948]
MGWVAWIILGFLAGLIARAIVPGRTEPGGCFGTTAIGVLGAAIGGFVAVQLGVGRLGDFFDLETWLIAIAGAVVLLLIIGALAGGRRSAGPPARR